MSINQYLKLGKFAREYNHSKTIEEINNYFGWIFDKKEMDYIGLKLQISIKASLPMYLHGYVISSALYKYLNNNERDNITILETGTARGFSSLILAKIMNLLNKKGVIHTIDMNSNREKIYNCLLSAHLGRKVSVNECLKEWEPLVNQYIKFHIGDSKKLLNNLNLERINFAFLDGAHYYEDVKRELEYVNSRQMKGDIIICDDYTKKQFPEICKAIDEFLENNDYNSKIFYGNDGIKMRGYVYMIKN